MMYGSCWTNNYERCKGKNEVGVVEIMRRQGKHGIYILEKEKVVENDELGSSRMS